MLACADRLSETRFSPSARFRSYHQPRIVRVKGKRGALIRDGIEMDSPWLMTLPFGFEALALEEVRSWQRLRARMRTTSSLTYCKPYPAVGAEWRRRRAHPSEGADGRLGVAQII